MKSYQSYLFDLDGTLITTIDLICNCFKFSLKKYFGHEFLREEILRKIGLPLKKQFTHFIESEGLNLGDFDLEQMCQDHMDYQMKIWRDHIRPYEHAVDVLASLKKQGKKLGIVTSRLAATTGLYLDHVGLSPYLDCVITPESTSHHKPHPEPALTALKQMGGEVSSAVMVGDSLFDMECGQAAGIDTLWVVHADCPWKTDAKLEESEPGILATAIITDLREVLPTPPTK